MLGGGDEPQKIRTEIDQKEWADLQKNLRRFAPEVKKELNKEMRGIVRQVANDARRRAPKRSGALRKKIIPQVTARNVAVVSKARHAWITEVGGRHPVFGNRSVWVHQSARPHMMPALRANQSRVERAAQDAVERAARKAGFNDH